MLTGRTERSPIEITHCSNRCGCSNLRCRLFEGGRLHGPAAYVYCSRIPQLYSVHVTTRKSLGLMMRKLSVTESQRSAQFRGTISRRKPSVASENWAQVA